MQIATTIGVVFPGIMHSIVILILLLLPFKIKKSSACILACLPTKVTLKLICFFVVPPFSRPILLQLEWKTSLSFISYSMKQKGEKMSANQITACVKTLIVALTLEISRLRSSL